ncbi:ABC-three component system protein [Sphaerisporangium krabiense]|nr:ABC-three component system protein [Sphaerisporangium krabiense]
MSGQGLVGAADMRVPEEPMSSHDDQDRAWFHSQFISLSTRKTGFEWQAFVNDLMHAVHPGDFVAVDPSGRGDKGCDGWVGGLMLACYGAGNPNQRYVTRKIETDFTTALKYWGDSMDRWAFVHNNANGLPEMAARAVIELRRQHRGSVRIEVWPPQVLWNHCAFLPRERLATITGSPPSDHPAGMSYIARCVESLARTRLVPGLDPVGEVAHGKIEHNGFGPEVADLIKRFQVHTGHVRYYFTFASPGEQAQVSENLRARFAGHRALLESPDAVFHALCDDLVVEAFRGGGYADKAQQRSAALMVVTHFFEKCEIFEAPGEQSRAASF